MCSFTFLSSRFIIYARFYVLGKLFLEKKNTIKPKFKTEILSNFDNA